MLTATEFHIPLGDRIGPFGDPSGPFGNPSGPVGEQVKDRTRDVGVGGQITYPRRPNGFNTSWESSIC